MITFEGEWSLAAFAALVHDFVVPLDSVIHREADKELTFAASEPRRAGSRWTRRQPHHRSRLLVTVHAVEHVTLADRAQIGEFNIVRVSYDGGGRMLHFEGGVDVRLTLTVTGLRIQVEEG